MAEPTLSLTLADLRERVSNFLGTGRTYSSLSSGDAANVDDSIDSGLRRFYSEHDWRFLRPVTSITCVVGTWQYDLPDDFGSMTGPMTFDPNYVARPISMVGESMIRVKRQSFDTSGVPRYGAIRYKSSTQGAGQDQELLLWPTPDVAYVLRYAYTVLPDNLVATTKEYPYGGRQHGQTILEACLAAAEAVPNGQMGLHETLYQQALARSRRIDAQGAAESLGANCDRSDDPDAVDRIARVTYNGVLYP